MTNSLVELRNEQKRIRPSFNKQSSHKKIRLKKKWRKPRGSDSKIRVNKKGYPSKVKIGYRGPRLVRNLSENGLNIKTVANVKDVQDVDPKTDIVNLSKIGRKKKIAVLKEIVAKGLSVLNIKDPKTHLEQIEKDIAKIKQDKDKKQKDKEIAKKQMEEKAKDKDDKKEGIEAKVDDKPDADKKEDDQKAADVKDEEKKEKKDIDKLLTKREL